MAGLTADLSGVGGVLKESSRAFATQVRREVRTAVTESGKEIVDRVKEEASWSTRIPDATSLRTSFGVRSSGVTVVTSASKAPHARPYELGSRNVYDEGEVAKRSRGNANRRRAAMSQMRAKGVGVTRMLSHPVFGDKNNWVSEPTRPFFFAAAEAATPAVEKRMDEAVNAALRNAGFKGA